MKIMDLGHYYQLFSNYCVESEIVKTRVPESLELDLFEGKSVLSWVVSTWQDVKVLGLPLNLKEQSYSILLRTYVKKREGNEWVRGYLPLECWMSGTRNRILKSCLGLGSSHALDINRSVHFEPYEKSSRGVFEYQWRDPLDSKTQLMRFRTLGSPQPALAGYLEYFTAEKNIVFVGSNRRIALVQEERTPWVIWEIDESVFPDKWPTRSFAHLNWTQPDSCFVVKGSKMTFRNL